MRTAEPLTRWRSLCDEIQHPDVELTVEEFAALLSVYKLLRAEGHQFDPAVVALMTVLERQAIGSMEAFEDETDSDEDDSDRDLDIAMADRRAIQRACARAFPPPVHLAPVMVEVQRAGKTVKLLEKRREWLTRLTPGQRAELKAWWKTHRFHPHQLRHLAATRWRAKYGAEATLVMLGEGVDTRGVGGMIVVHPSSGAIELRRVDDAGKYTGSMWADFGPFPVEVIREGNVARGTITWGGPAHPLQIESTPKGLILMIDGRRAEAPLQRYKDMKAYEKWFSARGGYEGEIVEIEPTTRPSP